MTPKHLGKLKNFPSRHPLLLDLWHSLNPQENRSSVKKSDSTSDPSSHNTHTAYRPRSKIPRSGDCQNLILSTDRLEAMHTEIKAFRTWNYQELENSLENVDVLYVRQSAKSMMDCKRYHILFKGYQAVSPRV